MASPELSLATDYETTSMKLQITLAALALGTTLFATAAFADGMSTGSPANTMMSAGTHNAMAPAVGGMMANHKPKPTKHTAPAAGGMMAPTNTMAPANGTVGSH